MLQFIMLLPFSSPTGGGREGAPLEPLEQLEPLEPPQDPRSSEYFLTFTP